MIGMLGLTEECGSIGDLLTGEKVHQAMERLTSIVHRTPLVTSETTNSIVNKQVYFKMENQQKTGAFKFRGASRSEEHTSELQSRGHLVCRLLLEKKKQYKHKHHHYT